MKKVYLAGPDVFKPNAIEYGKFLVESCLSVGLIGLYPMDNEISGHSPHEIATEIRKANLEMLRSCDGVLANISPFRGPGADGGTTYEIGFADALGKPVILYTESFVDYIDRIAVREVDGHWIDKDGLSVENFGLVDNLMYGVHPVKDNFRNALLSMKKLLEK